jgi:hypothetical protein
MGVAILVAFESAWRARRDAPRGTVAERLEAILLISVGVTIAGGLGLLVGGARPEEPLHFVYAVLAFGAVPVASSLMRRARPRQEAVATLAAALVAIVLVGRLFQTG